MKTFISLRACLPATRSVTVWDNGMKCASIAVRKRYEPFQIGNLLCGFTCSPKVKMDGGCQDQRQHY